uniref:Uncharacterized protein n=1 Tax=Arundo donax TaxID=35708 RepID=A0A0A8ZNN5_ARUDO
MFNGNGQHCEVAINQSATLRA